MNHSSKIVAVVGMALGILFIAVAVVFSRIRSVSDFGGTTFTVPPPPPSPFEPLPAPPVNIENPLKRIIENELRESLPRDPSEKVMPQDVAEIKKIFRRNPADRVDIIVWLNERLLAPEERTKGVIETVLGTLTIDEFRVTYRYAASKGFAGSASKVGYGKLLNDPRVKEIHLDRPIPPILPLGE